MAQFAAQHPINPPPPSPRRSRELSSAPEEEQRQEEVNSRVSRPEVAQTQEQYPPQSRPPTAPLPRGVEDPYLALAIAPPRRSPFSTAILAEALPAGVKVSNLQNTTEQRQPPHSRGYRRDFGGPAGGDSANARKALVRAARRNNWQTPNQIHNINSDKQGEIAFGEQDLDPMRNQNNDALVISATLSNFWVKKVLVDSGSSADIIFYDAYVQLGVDNAQLRKVNTPLTGFSGEMIEPLGEVTLPLSLGSYPKRSTKMVKFLWSRPRPPTTSS
ncbi:UNVERIFIED_CONTAM: hypothetical protein Sradi_2534100 [Sesamum radiatum]|uniref:Uncharacterized protein n=1 Tax=Sesamum radiatum TaxID=300843 RepID=A0AAW2SL05_SESRA